MPSVKVKTICSWCDEHLAGEEEALVVSHGACPICFDRIVIRLRRAREPVWVEELYQDIGGEG